MSVRAQACVRSPAPWPRRRGTWEVAPDAAPAVFAGAHTVVIDAGNGRVLARGRDRSPAPVAAPRA
ncbi:hypothetical protein C6W96_00605 [Streptomyces sp. CS149]|nr:hypothetical protein C6W96_00605 [Streptomyces sp. CS149]